MTHLIYAILVIGASMSYSWRFYGHENGYTVIEHPSPIITDANDGFELIDNAEVYLLDDTGGFKWILGNWTRNRVDFRMYSVWAKHYHGAGKFADPNVIIPEPNEPVIDPNEPILLPMVWVSQTGTKYHLRTCRYWNESFQEISIFDALMDGCTPCAVCKPDENL